MGIKVQIKQISIARFVISVAIGKLVSAFCKRSLVNFEPIQNLCAIVDHKSPLEGARSTAAHLM